MIALTWLRGLVAHRPTRVLATALGVAVGVALIASIGTFLSATNAKMTQRATARVAVDWQVQSQPGSAPAQVLAQIRSFPGVRAALPVSFLASPGLSATTGGSAQSTGAARVLGLPSGYAVAFPGELRLLSGSLNGPLLAQQTASNLHAAPGSTVGVTLPGGRHERVKIAGVVDLPAADSLFQKVGAAPGAQLSAPPDNVLLLPSAAFARVAAPVARARPELITTQIHVGLVHHLPGSPSAAYSAIIARAHNLESRLAGAGIVGDNLGVALDSARGDALYAQLLFLFLGVPGAVLAGLLTALIASAGRERRRRDAALLRTRGASTRALVALGMGETLLAGGVGVLAGLGAALLIGRSTFATASFGAGSVSAILWAAGAALTGLVIAAGAIALPALRDARSLTVAGQRRQIGRDSRRPLWARLGLDFIALALAGLVFWQASQNSYQLVLAPEGVAQVSVNWYALLAPVLGWTGLGLLAYRIALAVLEHGRRPLSGLLRPLAGPLAHTVAATMGRQRRLLAQTVALVALTAAFAASTSVFNSTYQAQAEIDARLTNGADVTVTEPPGAVVTPAQGQTQLTRVGGVASVEPLQHRYAYIGADLQDLFGVRPRTIGRQGQLQNAWFQGGSAEHLMSILARQPDAILASQETVHDYQLHPGDRLNLRLQDGRTHRLITVPFHYQGVTLEFPTAPKDSFFVANQSYVAARTGSPAVGRFLVQTDGSSPATVGARIQRVVGTRAQVTDIVNQRQVTGSNLTAVELSGLTRIELVFAFVLALTASAIALALGFAERRRTFAITAALGARGGQLGAFVWSESVFVTGLGALLGAGTAALLSIMLVDVLTGVFDPPPDALSIPWAYLAALAASLIVSVLAAGALTLRSLHRPAVDELRDL
jgi:putative ABC transport system permease protein